MRQKKTICSLVGCLLSTSLATAGDMGPVAAPSPTFRPVIAAFGGFANINMNHSQRFIGTDDDVFSYQSRSHNQTNGLVGGFLGAELPFANANFSMQAGVAYTYYGNNTLRGDNGVGIMPSTTTFYHYHYRVQTQQVAAVGKLLTTFHTILHPYALVGLGAAFNHAGNFDADTQQIGNLNLTPNFRSHSRSSFSYNLGLGLDADVNDHVRVGLGYQWSDLGKASLGAGRIVFNQYTFPVSFTLNTRQLYANQLIAQISYLA